MGFLFTGLWFLGAGIVTGILYLTVPQIRKFIKTGGYQNGK